MPDPALVSETKEWLAKAADDLRAAEHGMSASPPLLADVLFHCQQAVEKLLKAFLTWHNRAFRKTHSIEELGEDCLKIDQNLKDVIDRAVPLTRYAWEFRYPGEPEKPLQEEAETAISLAHEVYQKVTSAFQIISAHPRTKWT